MIGALYEYQHGLALAETNSKKLAWTLDIATINKRAGWPQYKLIAEQDLPKRKNSIVCSDIY
jgi:hypothetical protein